MKITKNGFSVPYIDEWTRNGSFITKEVILKGYKDAIGTEIDFLGVKKKIYDVNLKGNVIEIDF